MIVINYLDKVIEKIYKKLYCGVIMIYDVEGIYNYERKVVLIIVIICVVFNEFK